MNLTEPLGAGAGVSPHDAASFLHARPRLLSIARRVLTSTADADDIVQETWLRWQETDRTVVRDATAFLSTAATRLAINVNQSARARRETPSTTWLADLVDREGDPSRVVERDEALAGAVLVLLERLSPAERAVYLLRVAFDYPYRRIAAALALSEANARQLLVRARSRLGDERRRRVEGTEHETLLHAVVAALRTGELAPLEWRLAGDLARPV